MKIKKKEYQKQLDDKYWNGVQAGIKFALNNPKEADKYKDNIAYLRRNTMMMVAAFDRLSEHLANLFGGNKNDNNSGRN